MVIDINYWLKVGKKILIVVFTVLGLYLAYKLLIFYMPFLIGFVISIFVEPIIKLLMKKLKLNRKLSTIITLLIVLSIIIFLLFLGISSLIQEALELLKDMNLYVEKLQVFGNDILQRFNFDSINIPEELNFVITNSFSSFLTKASTWASNVLTVVLNTITSLPLLGIYIVITILATVFICMDRVYILDQLEHHIPKTWMKKVSSHTKEIISSLGSLLKAQIILIFITFIELLIGFYLLHFMNFNIEFPLIAALVTSLVDALPILGAGTVLVPWSIFSAINGDIRLSIALIIIYVIIIIVRQLMEPKIVSKEIGVHPIFTLIAMYTGLKCVGFAGLIIGPIVMIILFNVFAELLEQGIFKVIFNKK